MSTKTWYLIVFVLGIANMITLLVTKYEWMYIVVSIEFIWVFCSAIFWENKYNKGQEKLTELQHDYSQMVNQNRTRITDPMCICLHRESQHMSMGTCGEPNCRCTHFHTFISLKEETHVT